MTNPYSAPKARLADAPATTPPDLTFHRPWQVAVCGLFGGPLALLYLIRRNELALGDSRGANLTIYIGVALLAIAVAVLGKFTGPIEVGIEHAVLTALGVVWVRYRQSPRAAALDPPPDIPGPAMLVIVVLSSVGASFILSWIFMMVMLFSGFSSLF